MTSPVPLVIVPDGLAYDNSLESVLPIPSFVYRASLDFVIRELPSRTVFLAPANSFGSSLTEQAVASQYLRERKDVIVVPSVGDKYIDTRGNASQLREYFEATGLWELSREVHLVCAYIHMPRAILCFRKEGFVVSSWFSATYVVPSEEGVVPRLWYYRYPFFHYLYEVVAFIRDYLRPSSTKG